MWGEKSTKAIGFFCTGVVGFPYHKPATAASAPAGLRLSCPCARVCVSVCLSVLYGDRVVCVSPRREEEGRGGVFKWTIIL